MSNEDGVGEVRHPPVCYHVPWPFTSPRRRCMTQPHDERRQLVKYSFFRVDPAWRGLAPEVKERQKRELMAVLDEFREPLTLRTYSTVGLRADTDFLIWLLSWELEPLQAFAAQVNRTDMARYLVTPYAYLAMTRKSPYNVAGRTEQSQGHQSRLTPPQKPFPYLIVYPFVKTHDWYQLPQAERQRMMGQHFTIGHKYPNVRVNTTYSFGLDDQDHIVAFETTDLAEFLECVMELREAEQRKYTERDTPIFTCAQKPVREILDSLG
ncbi:MAG: chlorite dismutase [Dehalococcoidia bacterium]|nr:chlorite dismutase [Dehalococcoidia bacterium]